MTFLSFIRNPDRSRRKRHQDRDHSRCQGFTFFEVMVTVIILGVGIIFIFKAFMACLNYQGYLTARLYAFQLCDVKSAELQRQYQDTGQRPALLSAEILPVKLNNRLYTFQFDSNYSPVGSLEDVFEMQLIVSWNDYGRNCRMTRSVYLSRI